MKKLLSLVLLYPVLAFGGTVSFLDGVSAFNPNTSLFTNVNLKNTGCVNIEDAGGTAIGVLCLDASDDLNIGDATGVDNINLNTAGTITFSSVTGTTDFAGPTGANNIVEIQATTGNKSVLRMAGDDIAHPITSLLPSDVWLDIRPIGVTNGGALFTAINATGATSPLRIRSYFGVGGPSDGVPAMEFRVGRSTGSTTTTLAASKTAYQFSDRNGVGYLTIYGSGAQAIASTTTTQNAMDIQASSLTSGDGMRVYSNSTDASVRKLFYAVNANASATGTYAGYFQQVSTGNNLFLDTDGNAISLNIDSEATTQPAVQIDVVAAADIGFINFVGTAAANATNAISTWTTGNSIQGFIQIQINGTSRWIPFYDDPTS